MAGFEMNVALGKGVRRLPIYLPLDCSGSMSGAPIESVRRGVELFAQEVRADTFASQTNGSRRSYHLQQRRPRDYQRSDAN